MSILDLLLDEVLYKSILLMTFIGRKMSSITLSLCYVMQRSLFVDRLGRFFNNFFPKNSRKNSKHIFIRVVDATFAKYVRHNSFL